MTVHRSLSASPSSIARLGFLVALASLYVAVFLLLDRFQFPLRGDEDHFWPTTLKFARSALPSLELLRSYGELNTPLPFVIWGMLEHAFGYGVFAARMFNFLLSFGLVALLIRLGIREGRVGQWAVPVIGVLLFPYFIPVSTHAYTDILPTFLVLAGVALHLNRKYLLGALAFALAISARQYMIAFPLGIAAYELLGRGRPGLRWNRAWAAPGLAAVVTLGEWYLFFGGFGPLNEIARQEIVTTDSETLLVRNSLYFLACVGLYFVLPMLLLTRTMPDWRGFTSRWGVLTASVLLLLFITFPPLENRNFAIATMGFFDRALRPWLGDPARMVVFYAFALLAIVQLRGRSLTFALLLVNAVLMWKAHIAWDKYSLPLVAVLWYLAVREKNEARGGDAESRGARAHGEPGARREHPTPAAAH